MREYIYNIIIGKKKGILPAVIKFVLFILSLIYGLIQFAIRIFYRFSIRKTAHLNARVISVGNITWGGTGKTPLVEYMARYLTEHGRKVAILSRGYKRKALNNKLITYNSELITPYLMGDEPSMLKSNLKDIEVLVDANRVRSGSLAVSQYGCDTLLLDDGFQYRRLFRNLDIVAIDATNPFGSGKLIPAGIMREPKSALKRADILVLTKTNLNPDTQDLKILLRKINPVALIVESVHKEINFYKLGDPQRNPIQIMSLKGKTAATLSSIADPESFEKTLLNAGIEKVKSLRFPDHYPYTEKDLEGVLRECRENNIANIITTEKDAARLKGFVAAEGIFVLRMEVKIREDEVFWRRIFRIF